MDVPTAAEIRAWAPPDFPWANLGFAPPADGDPDTALQKRVDWAKAYIEATTWRPFSTIQPPDVGGNLPTVEEDAPIDLVGVAEQALMLGVLQAIARQSKAYITATVLQDYIQSFTAGSYSETRSSSENVIRSRGGSVENPLVNSWRELSDLLYLLMTPDSYDYWRYRLTGITAPAAGYIAQDFGFEHEPRPAIWGPGIESWPVGGPY
jgi:hypothetical protein